MNATRLPTLKAIMAENGCDINAARSIRARLEVEADRAHFRKTGRHTLEVVSARDLARHPELAVQDTARPKFTEWKVGDGLKTTEARAFFIEAAIEENDLAFLAQSLAEVAKAAGNSRGAAVMAALATCVGAAAQIPGLGAARRPRAARPRHKAATLAKA